LLASRADPTWRSRGDQIAFDRYSSAVYSIAFRVSRDPSLAEQVLSDIFPDIWRHPYRSMQVTCSMSVSMAMIACNRAVKKLNDHRLEVEGSIGRIE
jgi:DNA-directed RNA polymerase specialized sigma24 family protein